VSSSSRIFCWVWILTKESKSTFNISKFLPCIEIDWVNESILLSNTVISSFFSKTFFLSLIIIFSNCAGFRTSAQDNPFNESARSASDISSEEQLDSKKLYVYLKQQKEEITVLESKIDSLTQSISIHGTPALNNYYPIKTHDKFTTL